MRTRAVASMLGALLILTGAVFVLTAVRGVGKVTLAAADATRVQHTPEPKGPEPTPYPRQAPSCPQMTNPGGGIKWQRSADAGPWPTEGSVAIPSLGVDAPIVKVGVGTNGDMVVPGNARDVAWLDQGPFPGRTNNVVLAGHINYNRVRGSFASIDQLRPGDEIAVSIDGEQHTFRVTWNCAFPWDSDFAVQIMGKTLRPSVTLITCGGSFSSALGTHNQRITVRAELIDAVSA